MSSFFVAFEGCAHGCCISWISSRLGDTCIQICHFVNLRFYGWEFNFTATRQISDNKTANLPTQMTNLNAVIPILMHLFIFFFFVVEKNVLIAQSHRCCELRKTKCQPMRRDVTR